MNTTWPRLVWPLRVISLTLIASVALVLLTSAQIAYVYLSNEGVAGGLSAITINRSAERLLINVSESKRLERELNSAEAELTQATNARRLAERDTYGAKVDFRRFVLGCWPDPLLKREEGDSGLEYSTLRLVYIDARKASSPTANGCPLPEDSALGTAPPPTPASGAPDPATATPSATPLPPLGGSSSTATFGSRCDDAQVNTDRVRLDCLFERLTAAVSKESNDLRQASAAQESLELLVRDDARLAEALAADPILSSPKGRAAVETYLALRTNDVDIRKRADEANLIGSSEQTTDKQPGVLRRLLRAAGAAGEEFVGALVTMPLLGQSALLALFAGALGGGALFLWEALGLGPVRATPSAAVKAALAGTIDAVEAAVHRPAIADDPEAQAAAERALSALSALDRLTDALAAKLAEVERKLEQAGGQAIQAKAPLLFAAFSGSMAAFVIWLLTTGGLFVFSGGEQSGSADPTILIAVALLAGLSYRRVVDIVVGLADRIIK
jgi:hypothetical protein